jgi:hypothetical protein
VVHERLVAEYGFTGHYQRVKMFLAEARPRIAAELADRDENPLSGLHRRFEVVPGAQAQVDWGDEGDLLAHVGIPTVYSFHMVLSHSRDPFAVSPPAWIWPPSGTATGAGSRTSAGCPVRSSTTGRRL